MTPRRRKALEALVARGATPGEREAARQALEKALATERAAAPPNTSGPSRGPFNVHSGGFTITIDDLRPRGPSAWENLFKDKTIINFDPSFDEAFRFRSEPRFRGQDIPKPPPPGPFGDGSPGPGPKKCEPKPKGEAKFGAPRSCGYMFDAVYVTSANSPTGKACYRSGAVSQTVAAELMASAAPVVLIDGEAEFGGRCVTWGRHPQSGAVGAYFERLTDNGRYEAVGTIGEDFLVDCDERRALRLMRQPGVNVNDPMLYLVTHGGKTWICCCLGPCEGGARFAKVATRPAP